MAGKKGMHKRHQAEESVGAVYRERLRAKITSSKLTEVLLNHIVNGTEMSSTQVTAAMGLLRKVLPDLNSTELTAQVTTFTEFLDRVAAADTHSDPASAPPDAAVH